MSKNRFIEAIFLFVLFQITIVCVSAQVKSERDGKDRGLPACEQIKHVLDISILENSKASNTYVILLFRSGKNESSNKYNEFRIREIGKYLKRKNYLSRSVFALDTRSGHLPQLQIYVGGKVLETIVFKEKDRKRLCIE